ncbi:MAG: ABC transporter substrate-binding protein [Gemmatimonadales bacterium]
MPESEGGRLVFRQLYETLARVDCEGQPRQALEHSWSRDSMGSVWTFVVAPGHTFADGSPIDAAAVVAGWEHRATPGRTSALPRVISVQATGVREVRLRFAAPEENAPRIVSDWKFAIMGPAQPNGVPSASGPFVIASAEPASDGTIAALTLTPRDAGTHAPVLKFAAVSAGTDLRDALDRGIATIGLARIDVVLSRDPEVLAYVARRGDYRSIALPWDRTYVLVAAASALDAATPVSIPSAAERDALARDAVRSDARGAEPPFWWLQDSTCAASPRPPSGRVRREVGYVAGDVISRELAERVVALAALPARPAWIPNSLVADARSPLRVVPLPADSLDDAIASGRVAAAVLSRRRQAPAGCSAGAERVRARDEVPLIDSRAHVIFRGSGAAFSIEGDGTIRFTPAKP